MHRVTLARGGASAGLAPLGSWDPRPFLTDQNGRRLFEEISRRLDQSAKQVGDIHGVGLTLPGTLRGESILEGSSRLNIREEVDVTAQFKALGAPPTYVFHDAECMGLGEALSDDNPKVLSHGTFALLLVDEGIGASFFIEGKPYRGAGVAGHIGRLVVEQQGTFNPTFASRGTLEVFAARPWVSQNVVNEYLCEKGKTGALAPTASSFRAAVDAAASGSMFRSLTFQQLADGLSSADPVATSVLTDAAQHLSIAMNAIITIMNPPLIVMGGGMILEIPGFYDLVVSHARRTAWAGSWNETTIKVARLGRDAQVNGAAYSLARALAGRR
ncbi:ROK family protein [Maricaulis sp.]|uniref:ROK family protein n=1 Tax=Maricaulis sp. TaxID=1486257 RepID=UPI0032987FF1